MRILVIAAHPDDEVLGVGGTIVRHVRGKDTVKVVILGGGVASRYANIDKKAEEEVKALRQYSKKALEVLGVMDIIYHDFPDNKFDSVPLLDIVKVIENQVSEFKPDVIYTHFKGDLNIDHEITYRAVITACRPISGVKKILCFEVLSSTEQNVQLPSTTFTPNVYVNIEDTLGVKLKSMAEYRSELKKYPHPRSLEGIECLAKYRGLAIGCKAAEAFYLAREIM